MPIKWYEWYIVNHDLHFVSNEEPDLLAMPCAFSASTCEDRSF